ncbi:hypothetical protein ABW19_dt0207868 [Dactylella cylindrospora]|nr:hypothetical protein ABW19_dt0207868 [Dactylella cylindrospora]
MADSPSPSPPQITSSSSSSGLARPYIAKPKQSGNTKIDYTKVTDAFRVDYYNNLTSNWEKFKLSYDLGIVRKCASTALSDLHSQLEPAGFDLSLVDQPTRVQKLIHSRVRELFAAKDLRDDYRSLIVDMMESTTTEPGNWMKSWLYGWLVGDEYRRLMRKTAPERRKKWEEEMAQEKGESDGGSISPTGTQSRSMSISSLSAADQEERRDSASSSGKGKGLRISDCLKDTTNIWLFQWTRRKDLVMMSL